MQGPDIQGGRAGIAFAAAWLGMGTATGVAASADLPSDLDRPAARDVAAPDPSFPPIPTPR